MKSMVFDHLLYNLSFDKLIWSKNFKRYCFIETYGQKRSSFQIFFPSGPLPQYSFQSPRDHVLVVL